MPSVKWGCSGCPLSSEPGVCCFRTSAQAWPGDRWSGPLPTPSLHYVILLIFYLLFGLKISGEMREAAPVSEIVAFNRTEFEFSTLGRPGVEIPKSVSEARRCRTQLWGPFPAAFLFLGASLFHEYCCQSRLIMSFVPQQGLRRRKSFLHMS